MHTRTHMQIRAQGAAATCTKNVGGEDQDKNEGGEDQDKNEGGEDQDNNEEGEDQDKNEGGEDQDTNEGDDAVQERLGKLVHICCQLLNAHTHTHTQGATASGRSSASTYSTPLEHL